MPHVDPYGLSVAVYWVDIAGLGQLFDIRATFEVGDAYYIGLQIGNERVMYDAKINKLNDVTLEPVNGKVTMEVLVDRPMMEIIGNQGRVYITKSRQPGEVSSIQAFANGGQSKLIKLEAYELLSIGR